MSDVKGARGGNSTETEFDRTKFHCTYPFCKLASSKGLSLFGSAAVLFNIFIYIYIYIFYFKFQILYYIILISNSSELIQTQMTQMPMLREEVYARALRASQNLKEDSVSVSVYCV